MQDCVNILSHSNDSDIAADSKGSNSADSKLISSFSQKTDFDISCKLFPNCLFSGESKKLFQNVVC